MTYFYCNETSIKPKDCDDDKIVNGTTSSQKAATQEPLQFFRLLKVALKRAYSLVNDPDAKFLVYNDRDFTQEIEEKDDFSSAHWGFPRSIAHAMPLLPQF